MPGLYSGNLQSGHVSAEENVSINIGRKVSIIIGILTL